MQKEATYKVLDYDPFGMQMPARSFTGASGYKFGFNGMLKDGKDWTGNNDSHLDFGARIYDSRLGKFLSTDPWEYKYSWQSPYSYHRNSPIRFIDWFGFGDPELIDGVYFVETFKFSVSIVKRNASSKFTSTVLGKYDSEKTEYYVNLQQYNTASILSYPSVLLGSSSSDWITIGQNIENGKIISSGSETDEKKAYLAQSKEGEWIAGIGNPPEDVSVGFGGGIPVVINGQVYGEEDYAEQCSSKGYANQNSKKVGKTIIAYNSKTNAFMIVVSPDELESGGMTMDEIRDKLVSQGYDNVISYDGGSSATLVQDKKVLVQPDFIKDTTIPVGLKITDNDGEDDAK